MKSAVLILSFLIYSISNGQSVTKNVLFLGNSYTTVNNLPQMVANVATSTGDVLLFDSNAPGGYTLQGHSTNTTSLAKIGIGNWDFVVLQEQSQLPSFPEEQVENSVYPFAQTLDTTINTENPCAETVFYMTWGRQNGDASNCNSWPPVCTYLGMDDLLNLRYRTMANDNNAILSPVGEVWKYVRENYPEIILYQTDQSHPAIAGTYLAACTFYTILFRKDPMDITFNSTLSATDAANIRSAAKAIVYDNLMEWHVGEYDLAASFNSVITGNEVSFANTSNNATLFTWDFGDGNISIEANPTHTYQNTGIYTVTLTADRCGNSDSQTQSVNITSLAVNEFATSSNYVVFPNPATTSLTIAKTEFLNLSYKIINLTGQELDSGTIDNGSNQLSIAALPNGVYFLKLFRAQKLMGTRKFIKTKE